MKITRDISDAKLAAWLQSAPEEVLARAFAERDTEMSISEMAVRGGAFDYLADEPDIYTDDDLKEKNEAFVR